MATDAKKHASTWMNKKVINKIKKQISRKQRKMEHRYKEGMEERENGGKKIKKVTKSRR